MSDALPIVDAHVHLWDPKQIALPWLADSPLLNRPYGFQEYHEQTAGIPIEAMVYVEVDVQPQDRLREAQYVVELAQQDQRLQGIVAAATVERGLELRPYLESLVALSPLIKGVRRMLQSEADARICLQPDFIAGVRLLAEFGLSFDLCIRHWQLPAALELVRLCPDTTFILDHIAKPDIQHHLLDPWQNDIRELAELPNIVCKISGLVTEADLTAWQASDLEPFFKVVFEAFGEDRVLFGGDWPVALLASPYRRWYETLTSLVESLPLAARRKLWSENARRVYRLA